MQLFQACILLILTLTLAGSHKRGRSRSRARPGRRVSSNRIIWLPSPKKSEGHALKFLGKISPEKPDEVPLDGKVYYRYILHLIVQVRYKVLYL